MNRATPVLAVGWDVGGWMGCNHGVAVALWRPGGEVEWLGRPLSFSIGSGCWLSFQELLRRAGGARADRLLRDEVGMDLVVAIDAPLGFPRAFVRFLSGDEPAEILCPDREIESLLAYREKDRHVYGVFGKKPLSAAFDKLGNNATVAMAHVRRWQENHGFSVPPLTGPGSASRSASKYIRSTWATYAAGTAATFWLSPASRWFNRLHPTEQPPDRRRRRNAWSSNQLAPYHDAAIHRFTSRCR